jgi:hypothetical protein
MKKYITFSVLFAISIGAGLAMNADIGDVEAFKQALEKDGFTVQNGGLGYFDVIKLCDLGLLPSALGNNPTTKYLTYFVPPALGVTGGLKLLNSGGIKLSTCQSLTSKLRGCVDAGPGGIPHAARFIQPRIEHQRDRQKNRLEISWIRGVAKEDFKRA